MTKSIKLNIRTTSGEGTIKMTGDIESIEGKVVDRFFDALQAPSCAVDVKRNETALQENVAKEKENVRPIAPKAKTGPRIIPELNVPTIAPKEEKGRLTGKVLDRKNKEKPKRYFYSTDDGSDKKGVIDSKTRRALESIFLKAEEGEEVTPGDLEKVEGEVTESNTEEVYKGDNSHRDDRYTSDINDRNTGKPMEMFRCDYHCPSCGHQDSRYAAIRNSYVKCFKCETQMALEEAVPGEFTDEFISGLRVPVQDKNGAYFIARDFME